MFKAKLIGLIAGIIYRLYSFTFRYIIHFPDELINDLKTNGIKPQNNYLYAFWHQDEMAMIPYFSYKKIIIMVSMSKDGTILATALKFFGYKIISGSSSKRAIAAFIEALKKIKEGHTFAIAIDGPRGPAFESKEGVIKLSEKSNRPIFPLRAFPEKCFIFEKSWNKSRLPMPFSKIHIVVGKPDFFTKETLKDKLDSLNYAKTFL